MQTFTTPINWTSRTGPVTLNLHIVNDNVAVNMTSKTISGTISSFVSDNITDSYVAGSVRAAKTSNFSISDADLTVEITTTISTYLTNNLSTVIIGIESPIRN